MNEFSSALIRMIYGNWQSCVVGAFAELGIADQLHRAPMTAESIAAQTATEATCLRRFLRCAAALGLVGGVNGGITYRLTPLGDLLRSDHPNGLRSAARLNTAGYRYHPWGHLVNVLRTGSGRGFSPTHEHGTLDFLADKDDDRKVFHSAMAELSAYENDPIAGSYDFSPFRRVIELGGGWGGLIEAVLRRNPHLTGVAFDLEDFSSGAAGDETDVTRRLERRAGDFFAGVPTDGELYIMKNVIHNWTDSRASALLDIVRASWDAASEPSPPGGRRLLIIEHLLDDPGEGGRAAWLDLNFLILIGGQERDLEGYRSLAARSGFAIARVLSTPVGRSILELVPASDAEVTG